MVLDSKILEVKDLFEKIPIARFCFFPTPVHRLDRLSEMLGVELYLKRDDLTGISVYGGNKMRKLEFLMGDAVDKGAEYVLTYGATQSNHAMQTATACRKCGLEPILYLISLVPPVEDDLRSNLLLDKIMGAEIHIITPKKEDLLFKALEQANDEAQERIKELEDTGLRCYEIPAGGANPVGTLGFASGMTELYQQLNQLEVEIDYIAHATGLGGTLAGMAAGRELLETDVEIISFGVVEKPPEHLEQIANLANKAISLLGKEGTITLNDFNIDTSYLGDGYAIPTEASTNTLKLLARREGILIDPVYTAKAFSGLIGYIKKGKIPQGSKVLFWHTGGTTALFAEQQMVGKVYL